MDQTFFNPTPRLSPILKTIDGLYIHLKDVDKISAKGFGDETETMMELEGKRPEIDVSRPKHLWVKIGESTHVIPLDDDFNSNSMLIDAGYYSSDKCHKAERRIVELWSSYHLGRTHDY